MIHAPRFWSNPPTAPGLAARLLQPLGAAYAALGRWRRQLIAPQAVGPPVICVGNLTAGGAGKTPLVIALLERLAQAGRAPHALSRGYGGTLRGPHRVDPQRDTAADTGDEPLLLSAWAPTWISRDRVAGARAVASAGAGVIVMDDGFQNPALIKDLSLVVVDAAAGFGNGRLLPAGPLRERVPEGLRRADAVVLVGNDGDAAACLLAWPVLQTVPILRATVVPLETGFPLNDQPVIAFAGIARPQKFFDTLNALGSRVLKTHSFADHQPFSRRILERMLAEARQADALLVTTEKDAVRLPPAIRREVMAVPVRLRFVDEAALDKLLRRLSANQTGSAATSPRAEL